MNPKVVAAAIIRRDGEILIARRRVGLKLAGYWEFPGGKVEPNETPQQCLERELLEELGVVSHAGEIVAESDYAYEHGYFKILAINAQLEDLNFFLTVHDQAVWVKVEDLLHYRLLPADLSIVEKLQKEIW